METALLDSDQAKCRSIGELIDKQRRIKKKSQLWLAHEAGITPATYQKLAKGKAKLSTVITTMRILDMSPIINLAPDSHVHTITNESTNLCNVNKDQDSEW